MITRFGYIDEGFKPKLDGYLNDDHKEYFKIWNFEPVGLPAPVLDERYKAAVWIGNRVSKFNESPLLAVALPKKKRVISGENMWYVGSNILKVNPEVEPKDRELELARLAIEATEHGPYVYYDAVNLLKEFMPVELIDKA